jgi:spectinomycin phosphotransferase
VSPLRGENDIIIFNLDTPSFFLSKKKHQIKSKLGIGGFDTPCSPAVKLRENRITQPLDSVYMLEKPNISDCLIISQLHEQYGLRVRQLEFIPRGADMGTAVYRVIAENGAAYFLKLRKGFEEIIVTVPLLLKAQGIQEIIPPFETKSKQGWADFGEYKMILYPFIEGQDGFDRELTDEHRRTLGAALRKIHTAQVSPELRKLIPGETFSPQWRERLKSFQALVENKTFDDLTATKLVNFMNAKRNEIHHLLERTEELTSRLQSQSLELVLCHTDIHGGNILVRTDGKLPVLYISTS